ncbi:MAG: FISUMP domain-containing protein [Bacteroidales bacterium]
MNKFKIFKYILAIIFPIIIISCSDDDESTTPYMTGSITFDYPMYVMAGDVLSMEASGILDPTDPTYYWISSSDYFFTDTIWGNKCSFVIPEDQGLHTFYCVATKDGYNNSTHYSNLYTIDTTWASGSLTGIDRGGLYVKDQRDSKKYYYVEIGDLLWFNQNLSYAGTEADPIGQPWGTYNCLGCLFGRLYSWNEATNEESKSGLGNGPQGICPEGWTVPTNEDWENLAQTVMENNALTYNDTWVGIAGHLSVEAYFNENKMWQYNPINVKTNDFKWNALPTGNSVDNNQRFQNLLKLGMWWSSTEVDEDNASYRYLYYDDSVMPMHIIDKKGYGVSIRCVKKK